MIYKWKEIRNTFTVTLKRVQKGANIEESKKFIREWERENKKTIWFVEFALCFLYLNEMI